MVDDDFSKALCVAVNHYGDKLEYGRLLDTLIMSVFRELFGSLPEVTILLVMF